MMKFLIQLLLIIFFVNPFFGQNTDKNSIKVEKLIDDFPKIIKNQTDFNVALTKINLLKEDLKLNPKNSSKSFLILNSIKNAVEWAEKKENLKTQLSLKYFYFGLAYNNNKFKESIEIGSELIKNENNLTSIEFYSVLTVLHACYRRLEAYDEIIKIIPLRKKYSTIEKSENGLADIEHDLAIAYYNNKNYKLSIKSFLIRKQYYKKIKGEELFVSSMSNNIGLCYLKLKNYTKALEYFNTALSEINSTINVESKRKELGYNKFFKAIILTNIAKIDIINGNYQKAIFAYNNLVQKTKIAGEKNNITDGYLNLSKLYFTINKIKIAEKYLDSTKNSNLILANTDIKIDYLNTKAKMALYNRDIELATTLFQSSKNTTDSLALEQFGRENVLAQAKYNSDEKDKELMNAKIDIKANEKASTIQRIGLLITLFLLSIILILYFKTSKDKKTIKIQKDDLLVSLTEKETLLKELHHRVKNNLQVIVGLLQLQSKKVNAPEMTNLLDDATRHINSMALVHEMLYQQNDYEVVLMKDYLTKLCNQIIKSFYDKKIAVLISTENVALPINRAIPIGLMISELITNSNKYAFNNNEGTIHINLIEDTKNHFKFEYLDNGKGLPENYNEKMKKTMGLRLLTMLSEEIDGTLALTNENGFKATIHFTSYEKI